ncbi:MAG: hypothetical protein Q9226_008294 [Calogaya cf. arnoldii]
MSWILDTPANVFPKFKEYYIATHPSDALQAFQSPGLSNALRHRNPPQLVDATGRSSSEKSQASKAMPPKNPKLSSLSMKCHRIPEGVDPKDPEFQNIMRKQLAEEGVLADDTPIDPKHEENAKKMNLKSIQAPKDPNYLWTTNPIYCGIVSFRMLTDFEAAGISLSNWHNSIWPTAHLYNALQQLCGISRSWPEMDKLIDLHMAALFADHIPLSAHEFFVRFALALGLPMSSITRNTSHRSNNASQRFRQGANGIKLKTTEVSSVFRQYFEKKSSLEVCLLKLDKLMRDPGPRASKKEKDAWKRPITNLQFLAMLEANLPRITRRLRFDYITLTKQCVNLLKKIRQMIMLHHGVVYPRIPTEDSADQTLTWVVMCILEENNDLTSNQMGTQGLTISPQLSVAKDEIEKFLGTYRPQDLISNFNSLPRPAMTLSGRVPNHWNISIRHVAISPPGDLVFFVQPDTHYVHTEGPIQTVEGQIPGHVLNPKSLVTLQTIARLIMKAFVEGMGVNGSDATFGAPWTWTTNDSNFARRIIKVMTDMGVRQDLMGMAVADEEELKVCDEAWEDLKAGMMGMMEGM